MRQNEAKQQDNQDKLITKNHSIMSSTSNRIPDSHLSSAIRPDNRKLFLSKSIKIPRHIRESIANCPINRDIIRDDSEYLYGEILSITYSLSDSLHWVADHLDKYYQAASDIATTILKNQNIHISTPKLNADVRRWYSAKVIWEDVRSKMQYKDKEFLFSRAKSPLNNEYLLYYNKYYLLLSTDIDQWWIFDYEQVMMIADSIASRVFTLIYNYLTSNSNITTITGEQLIDIYKIFDNQFNEKGNKLFDEIKMVEPIIVGTILSRFDKHPMSEDFINIMIQTAVSEGYSCILRLKDYLTSINSVQDLAEIHGIYRHWGHPTVDETAGCAKVKKIGQQKKTLNQETINAVDALVKRQFCIAFIKKHHRWPNIILTRLLRETIIGKAIETGNVNINLYSPLFPLLDWGLIRFDKEFEMDTKPDFTSIIDDKSICLPRHLILASYNQSLLNKPHPLFNESRRVLIEALRRPEINIKDILALIEDDTIPLSWLVIGVHSKEREHKLEPRLFAMMVLEMRLYFCVTESNIKDKILPYFPQQTMNASDRELQKRLIEFTSMDNTRYVAMFAGIDFSSWNIHWRYESTESTFKMIDHLFGYTNLVSHTHKFFSKSMLILMSHLNPPDSLLDENYDVNNPRECDTLWYNHLGGLEGLRQKGWTIVTIGLLLLVELRSGLKTILIGAADNQIAKLLLPLPEGTTTASDYLNNFSGELSRTLNNYLYILDETAKGLGLIVKVDETWISHLFISYGKEMLYKGVYLSQTYKRVSRIIPDVNDVFPSIYMKVSTLQATVISALQKGYDMIYPYILALTEVFALISRDISSKPHLRELKVQYGKLEEKEDFLILLGSLTSDIGKLPLTPYLSCFYRGHPDPLTTLLTGLIILSKEFPIIGKFLTLISKKEMFDKNPNSEILILNPCSVNLEGPSGPGTQYKALTQELVNGILRNKDIRGLIRSSSNSLDKKIYNFLLSTEPLVPRVLHELYRQSITANINEFLSKFSNSRTFLALLKNSSSNYTVNLKLEKAETELVEYWMNLYKKSRKILITDINYPSCSRDFAQTLRDLSWSNATNGRPIVGSTVPHPYHQFSFKWLDHPLEFKTREYAVFVINSVSCKELINTSGPYDPYLGSETREKTSGRVFQVPNCGRPLASAERLLQLSDWIIDENSTLQGFIHHLIRKKTDLPYDLLATVSRPISGGSVLHRLNDHITKRGSGNNFRSTITSNVYFSSDHLGRFSRGNENYNVHYQGLLHAGLAIIISHISASEALPSKYLYAFYNCESCTERIPDINITSKSTHPVYPQLPPNPLLFISIKEIEAKMSYKQRIFIESHQDSASSAAAHIILARIINTTGVFILGSEQYNPRKAAKLPIYSLTTIGLSKLLTSLCELIYLVWGMTPYIFNLFWRSLNRDIYTDLVEAMLLPENLHLLLPQQNTESSPDLFLKGGGAYRSLRALIVDIYRDVLKKKKITVIFYVFEDITVFKILKMWIRNICHNFNLAPPIKVMEDLLELANGDESLNLSILTRLFTKLKRQWGFQMVSDILKNDRPRISYNDPLSVIEDERKKIPINLRRKLPEISVLDIPLLPYFLELKLPSLNIEKIDLIKNFSISDDKMVRFQEDIKTREDQSYRLYGTTTTAYYKYAQILRHVMPTLGTAICLAEGEGGVARFLAQLGNSVFFNTKVDTKSLIPHRALGYTPSACILIAEKVSGGSLSALSGGDITDMSVIRAICSIAPRNVDILTCDAESKNQTPLERLYLVSASMTIAHALRAKTVIIKSFSRYEDILKEEIAMIGVKYFKVKVVVPLFSSHENTECFIIGEGFIDEAWEMGAIYTITNCPDLFHQLRSLNKSRHPDSPLQRTVSKTDVQALVDIGKQCLYDNNLSSNVSTMLMGSTLFNFTRSELIDQLASIRESTRDSIEEISVGFTSQLLLKDPTTINLYDIITPRVISSELKYWCLVTLNIEIIQMLLDTSDNKEIIPRIESMISFPVTLPGVNGPRFIYNAEVIEWKQRFLKSAWRIWGHWHLRL